MVTCAITPYKTLAWIYDMIMLKSGVGAVFPLLRGAGFGAKNRDTGANFEKKRGAFQSLLPA